jgi:hypothetical protein
MPVTPDIPAAEAAIVEMTNALRADHKLSAVTPNPQLAAAARAYARVLATAKGGLSHTANRTTPATRVRSAGYAHCQIAENLSALYDSRGFTAADYARRTLQGWEDSPGHRKNMLMPNVTEIGVAVVRSAANDPRYIAVQLFARPLRLKYTFRIANRATQAVSYSFSGEEHVVVPRETVTHGACLPGTLTFKIENDKAAARYLARDGQVYTLKPRKGGGVQVEVDGVTPQR